jgi:hypothetical protein
MYLYYLSLIFRAEGGRGMAKQTEVWQRWGAILILSLALLVAGIVPAQVSPADPEKGACSIRQKTKVLP